MIMRSVRCEGYGFGKKKKKIVTKRREPKSDDTEDAELDAAADVVAVEAEGAETDTVDTARLLAVDDVVVAAEDEGDILAEVDLIEVVDDEAVAEWEESEAEDEPAEEMSAEVVLETNGTAATDALVIALPSVAVSASESESFANLVTTLGITTTRP